MQKNKRVDDSGSKIDEGVNYSYNRSVFVVITNLERFFLLRMFDNDRELIG